MCLVDIDLFLDDNNVGSSNNTTTCFYLFQMSESLIAENCIKDPSTVATNPYQTKAFTSHNITYTSNKEVYSYSSPEKENMDLARGVDAKDNTVHVSICQFRIQNGMME